MSARPLPASGGLTPGTPPNPHSAKSATARYPTRWYSPLLVGLARSVKRRISGTAAARAARLTSAVAAPA
ncbi:hypothetical protein [Streptomyces fodineus]|uniref:hypothetical protein n=1 Tax=Streptomyces fodineus TaxID=1904616 RepID=UPI00131BA7CC